jgi:hypothetical protein
MWRPKKRPEAAASPDRCPGYKGLEFCHFLTTRPMDFKKLFFEFSKIIYLKNQNALINGKNNLFSNEEDQRKSGFETPHPTTKRPNFF